MEFLTYKYKNGLILTKKGLDTVQSLSAGARESIFLSMQDLPKLGLLYMDKSRQTISTTT